MANLLLIFFLIFKDSENIVIVSGSELNADGDPTLVEHNCWPYEKARTSANSAGCDTKNITDKKVIRCYLGYCIGVIWISLSLSICISSLKSAFVTMTNAIGTASAV